MTTMTTTTTTNDDDDGYLLFTAMMRICDLKTFNVNGQTNRIW